MNKKVFDISGIKSLVEVLDYRAAFQPDKTAFIFLQDNVLTELKITYSELQSRAKSIAARLLQKTEMGDRALLLYPPGIDYIEAFFGCLYAGVIALPVFPPDTTGVRRSISRLTSIIANADPSVVLTNCSTMDMRKVLISNEIKYEGIELIETDLIETSSVSANDLPEINRDSIAFLQYTSGSTKNPKGVMIRHDNMLNNLEYIQHGAELSAKDISVLWLPFFHDMGLVNGVLQPVYTGYLSIFMSPVSFLRNPVRWLQAISDYKATYSGGPNFGYKLCASRISQELKNGIDLSSLRCAFIGAEPIQKKDVESFSESFSSCGFRKGAFYTAYGLAEATVAVSGGLVSEPPIFLPVDPDSLQKDIVKIVDNNDSAKHISGCGRIWPGMQVIIVDPVSLKEKRPYCIGEVWVKGGSVSPGYWNNSEDSDYTFNAYTSDTGEGPFLRTGDLGFIHDMELFVTGRLKDLIIVNGENHYPQDIEATVEQCSPYIRSGCIAAFSVNMDNEERPAILCEIRSIDADITGISEKIRMAVSKNHNLSLYGAGFVKPGAIFKTSSGKIQRNACRRAFLEGTSDLIEKKVFIKEKVVETAERVSERPQIDALMLISSEEDRVTFLINFLCKGIADILKLKPEDISPETFINSCGIDSIDAVEIAVKIEKNFGILIAINDFFEDISIRKLAIRINDVLIKTGSNIFFENNKAGTDIFKVSDNVERMESGRIPFFPGITHYSDEAVNTRLKWVEKFSGVSLQSINKSIYNNNSGVLAGNIENYIGSVQIPVGIAGPVKVNGEHASGLVPVTVATTEGALVSSITRGAMACNYAGGVNVHVNHQCMLRAPVFFCKDFHGAIRLEEWVRNNYGRIKSKAESVSSIAGLTRLNTHIFGDSLHIQFYYTTGDAAGQNMTTSCTWVACEWIVEQIKDNHEIGFVDYFIEGNMSGDKKANYQNLITGRGINVIASIFIPKNILEKTLRVSVERYMRGWDAGVYGSMQTGMMGFNVNFANVIAGIFASTGQDMACIHESSTGIFMARRHGDGILFNAELPSLVIGTVGGGTGLSTQRECLEIMGCSGSGKLFRLAEIIAASCVALDISTSAAISANEFVKAHEKLGRNRPERGISRKDINNNYFNSLLKNKGITISSFENIPLDANSGIVSSFLNERSSGFQGIFRYILTVQNRAVSEKRNAVLKIKSDDSEIIDMGNTLARLSGEDRLPGLFESQNHIFGFNSSHIRELEFYRKAKPGILDFCPEIFGIERNDQSGNFAILMEDLSGCSHFNISVSDNKFEPETIKNVLTAMSRMHSVYWNRAEEVSAIPDINYLKPKNYSSALELLKEITLYNRNRFPEFIDNSLYVIYSGFLDNLSSSILSMNSYHQTLIHNDFNPRNFCLREVDGAKKLVLYDWELASYRNPQYDLLEFLVNAMEEGFSMDLFDQYVDFYFGKLQEDCTIVLNRIEFEKVLFLNAVEMALVRFNLYLLVHNVAKFTFMEKIYGNLSRIIMEKGAK